MGEVTSAYAISDIPSYRRTNKKLRRLVGVEPITTVIRSGRLIWNGHVMRTG